MNKNNKKLKRFWDSVLAWNGWPLLAGIGGIGLGISFIIIDGATDDFLFMLSALLVIIGGFLVYSYVTLNSNFTTVMGNKAQEKAAIEAKISQCACYLKNDSQVYVMKCDPCLKDAFTIVDDADLLVSYQPEEYIYTGATVGGISMGSVNKYEGYHYISGASKNGKYRLNFKGETVISIKLASHLYEKAKQSPIAPFLNKDESKQQIDVIILPDMRQYAEAGYSAELTMSLGMLHLKDGYPSREKCEAILRWLTNPN